MDHHLTRTLIVLGLIAACPATSRARGTDGPGAGSDTLALATCVDLAERLAPEVRLSAIRQGAARFDSIAAAAKRRPPLALFGGVTLAPRGFYDPTVTNLGEYQLKAGVQWTLLDGGSRERERERAADAATGAALELARARREAGRRAAALAIETLRLRERERLERQSLAWLERLVEALESAVQGGSHNLSDALRVGLERDAVEAALRETLTDLGTASRELGQLLGRDPSALPVVREPSASEPSAPGVEDSVRILARLGLMPELQMAHVVQAERTLAVGEARQRDAMRLDASADAGLAGADLTTTVPADLRAERPDATLTDRLRRDLGASTTLEFRKPIADPSLRPEIRARQADLEAAALGVSIETDTQRRLALDLLARWRASSDRLAAAQSSVQRAEVHMLRQRSLYAAGDAALLDLLDARRVLDEARERLADSRSENRAARAEAELRR